MGTNTTLGGVTEASYYLRSEQPSPCVRCSRLLEDKNACSEGCRALLGWQVAAGALPKVKQVKVVRNNHQVCGKDGGPLVYEDGVIYCGWCQRVYMRMQDRN